MIRKSKTHEIISEKMLKKLILEDIETFLEEARKWVELKVIELNSSHTGQIQKYMNYVDKNIKTVEENKTVGIIVCKKNNKYVIGYCSDDRIIARVYELV